MPTYFNKRLWLNKPTQLGAVQVIKLVGNRGKGYSSLNIFYNSIKGFVKH